jgi:hypothetical protein
MIVVPEPAGAAGAALSLLVAAIWRRRARH